MTTRAQESKRPLQQFKTRVFDRIYDSEPVGASWAGRAAHTVVKIIVMVTRDFFENLVKLQAMALAFKTLLSLAPALAVIFSILKAFGVHNRMEPALLEALEPLGDKGEDIIDALLNFVDRMSASALGSVGLITLFLTVLSLMATIEDAFNHVWRVRSPRTWARKFSDYLSVILVGPVLIFSALTITATLQSSAFVQKLIALEPFGAVILGLLRLLPYLTLWGAYTFFYIFIPNTQVRVRSALIGGLVAAILWQTVGWGFAVFVASSTQYYAIYSSFAILLLFLFWLHIGWVIVLLGAQVAYAHQHLRFYQPDRELLAHSPAGREKLALQMMLLIGRNFYHGRDALSVADVAALLRIPAGLTRDFMEMFEDHRLVLALADQQTYVIGRDPETIGIKEILDCVRNAGRQARPVPSRNEDEQQIDELLEAIDRSAALALQHKNLQSLILSVEPLRERAATEEERPVRG
ncbi:MAG: YihY/virulence factor BrkB family protein [Deltaproteobacteria bacterium]|nr:YihY/virulence factor BrkB family protein [Deltaproteobacteria bacterium]